MNIFSDMKIGTRLGLAFGAVLLITALISGMGIWRLNTLKVASEELATVELERNSLAQSWTANINLNWVRTSAALHAADLAEVTVLQKDMAETSKKISESQKRMVTLIQDEKGKELMADIGKKRELYSGPRADLLKRKLAGDNVAADSDRSLRPLAEDYLKAMANLEQHMDERLTQSQAQAAAIASTSQMAIGGGAVLAAVLGLLFAVLATRSITVPMQRAIASAETITQGNLSASLETSGKDETGQLLKALSDMKDNLARIVGDVRQNAHGVATASAEIAQGNHDLSARTEQQASALEETAASMEELSATVKQNADSARQANQLAMSASTVAVKGGEVVGQVVETMKGINDSSRKIADIISVIDGIAFQTNILALNAAVEAARAGEQGRGFAVVASEVRSLAGRSAEAAKEIKALIGASVERVEQGTTLVDQAGVTMTEVVSSIRRVTDLMGEISAASNEQSSGVSQVGEAVTQMDQATQQNAALVEEMAAAASSLKSQAQELVATVAVFKLGNEGAQPVSQPRSLSTRSTPGFKPVSSATSAKAPVLTERRSPNRATNVARMPAKPPSPRAAPAPAAVAKNGSDDEWTSF